MASTPFSAKVKKLRAARGLTQAQLADLAGLNRVYVAKIEGGQKENPQLETIRRLAKALRVRPGKLVD